VLLGGGVEWGVVSVVSAGSNQALMESKQSLVKTHHKMIESRKSTYIKRGNASNMRRQSIIKQMLGESEVSNEDKEGIMLQ